MNLDLYLGNGEKTWYDIADRVSGIMQRSNERQAIFEALKDKKLIPNSPALIHGNGPGSKNLMACQVIVVGDSLEEILDAVKVCGATFKSGGGIGLELSQLSPEGTPLRYAPQGVASGPVSFMRLYNVVGDVIPEGGLRRAAMMATLNAKHPDILKFIGCKKQDGQFRRFNISMTVDSGPDSVPADVWSAFCKNSYNNGEPGVAYLDHINRSNPLLDELGPIVAVNACAELPLYHYGSCAMAHVVLPRLIKKLGDYGELQRVAALGVKFLDRVISVNPFPLPEFAQVARDIRNIGLGVMGWATLLEREGIPFASPDALKLADEVGQAIYAAAFNESWKLAEEEGGYRPGRRRNSFLTTIAPTGHTSLLAGVSHSIYPPYAVGMQMTVDQQLDMVDAWQKHIDTAISYTISFPNDAPENITDRIFRGAYDRGIKVMSVYRDGSRPEQPCNIEGDCGL